MRDDVAGWQDDPTHTQSLYHTLRTLQHMVTRLEDGEEADKAPANPALLRAELLPSLLWACVSILHRAFSQPLRDDCELLVTAIDVVGSLLTAVRDDAAFEAAVYAWKRRHDADLCDDHLVFVGIQPLLMRCLLPSEIAVYTSFPCLNWSRRPPPCS